jgi:hypothetical protein
VRPGGCNTRLGRLCMALGLICSGIEEEGLLNLTRGALRSRGQAAGFVGESAEGQPVFEPSGTVLVAGKVGRKAGQSPGAVPRSRDETNSTGGHPGEAT